MCIPWAEYSDKLPSALYHGKKMDANRPLSAKIQYPALGDFPFTVKSWCFTRQCLMMVMRW